MKKVLPVLLIIIFSSGSYLSPEAQTIDTVLEKLNTEYKQEKLYLHFDKAAYNAGETIWFNAYLFTGSYPSVISTTLYAELVDDKGKVLERKTAPVVMSSAAS